MPRSLDAALATPKVASALDAHTRDVATDARISVAGAVGAACLGTSMVASAAAPTSAAGAAAVELPSEPCVMFAGGVLCRHVVDPTSPLILRAEALFGLYSLYGQDWNAGVPLASGSVFPGIQTTLRGALQACAEQFKAAVGDALGRGVFVDDEAMAERVASAAENLDPFLCHLGKNEREGSAKWPLN